MTQSGDFADALVARLRRGVMEMHVDNHRYYHHRDDISVVGKDREFFLGREPPYVPLEALAPAIRTQVVRCGMLHDMLGDDVSRSILVDVAAFMILGHRHIRLPYHEPELRVRRWRMFRATSHPEHADADLLTALQRDLGHHVVSWFDLAPCGPPISCCTTREEAYRMCFRPSYVCPHAPDANMRPGDVILSCGGCLGEISLYMAHVAGETGHVHAFEPHPFYMRVLKANLAANPELAARITHVPLGVSSGERKEATFMLDTTSSRILGADAGADGHGSVTISLTSLDAYVEEHGLDRVDFIKMDIEGGELDALRGAERTLRRFRPRCAISLYHRPEDMLTLPAFLRDLDLGYRMHLNHHSVCEFETILYAVAD